MNDEPKFPIGISYIGSKYLLFDINAITWLRRTHNICGVMSGTLPQSPSQNIFLGLPVQIMPEEAQLLVEKGVAYVIDDAKAHDEALRSNGVLRQADYVASLRKRGEEITLARMEEREEIKRQSLKNARPRKAGKNASSAESSRQDSSMDETEISLFRPDAELDPAENPPKLERQIIPHVIVPATSTRWLPTPPQTPSTDESMALLPNVPPSYALYKHLASKSYFMTPGLRFGCQYCVYPGDPLRFHSHFLAVGTEWDEEIDLLHIVGGGRLGTGVKKGFLIGGLEPPGGNEGVDVKEGRVRTFSIEWAAM